MHDSRSENVYSQAESAELFNRLTDSAEPENARRLSIDFVPYFYFFERTTLLSYFVTRWVPSRVKFTKGIKGALHNFHNFSENKMIFFNRNTLLTSVQDERPQGLSS